MNPTIFTVWIKSEVHRLVKGCPGGSPGWAGRRAHSIPARTPCLYITPLLSPLLFLSLSKEHREEGRVITSLNLAWVQECGVSCIKLYGRCTKKNTKIQHISVVWLLMKKCHQKMKEDTSESRLTIDIPFQMIDRADNMMTKRGRSDQIFGSLSQTKSRDQQHVDTKCCSPTLWNVFSLRLQNSCHHSLVPKTDSAT